MVHLFVASEHMHEAALGCIKRKSRKKVRAVRWKSRRQPVMARQEKHYWLEERILGDSETSADFTQWQWLLRVSKGNYDNGH